MAKCSICEAKVHKDDLFTIETPKGGAITNICQTCVDNAEYALRHWVESSKNIIKLRKKYGNFKP